MQSDLLANDNELCSYSGFNVSSFSKTQNVIGTKGRGPHGREVVEQTTTKPKLTLLYSNITTYWTSLIWIVLGYLLLVSWFAPNQSMPKRPAPKYAPEQVVRFL